MSDHPRKLIRKAFSALLKGATAAGENVRTTRSSKVWDEELRDGAALAVYTLDEEGTTYQLNHPRTYQRTVQLAIEAHVGEYQPELELVDDALDDLLQEVECVIDANLWLPDCEDVQIHADLSRYLRTEIGVDEEARMLTAVGRVIYEIVYFTNAATMEREDRSGQFTGGRARFDVKESADSTPEAESEIDPRDP